MFLSQNLAKYYGDLASTFLFWHSQQDRWIQKGCSSSVTCSPTLWLCATCAVSSQSSPGWQQSSCYKLYEFTSMGLPRTPAFHCRACCCSVFSSIFPLSPTLYLKAWEKRGQAAAVAKLSPCFHGAQACSWNEGCAKRRGKEEQTPTGFGAKNRGSGQTPCLPAHSIHGPLAGVLLTCQWALRAPWHPGS